jgi:hypothetical protein
MYAAQHYPDLFTEAALPKQELLEIHRSTISIHHAKTGYNYPTIRLPHTFEALTGLSTRIFQTVHHGALAFLVVISSASSPSGSSPDQHENVLSSAKASVFTRRRSPVRIRQSPLLEYGEEKRIPLEIKQLLYTATTRAKPITAKSSSSCVRNAPAAESRSYQSLVVALRRRTRSHVCQAEQTA